MYFIFILDFSLDYLFFKTHSSRFIVHFLLDLGFFLLDLMLDYLFLLDVFHYLI